MDTIRISTILSFITNLVNEGTIVQGYVMLSADEAKVNTATDSIRLTVLSSHNNYIYILDMGIQSIEIVETPMVIGIHYVISSL